MKPLFGKFITVRPEIKLVSGRRLPTDEKYRVNDCRNILEVSKKITENRLFFNDL